MLNNPMAMISPTFSHVLDEYACVRALVTGGSVRAAKINLLRGYSDTPVARPDVLEEDERWVEHDWARDDIIAFSSEVASDVHVACAGSA